MMRQDRLQDRIAWGANIAARAAGAWADAYRPSGPNEPIAPEKRYLRLPALFTGFRGKFERPLGFGETVAYGIFDSEYTRPGDYIALNDAVWFILSQDPLLPVLCARATRVVSFSRPTAPASTGVNAYGGVTSTTTTPLASGWPASITGASGAGEPSARLPTDIGIPYWIVLLPEVPTVTFLPTDLLTDDLGRQAVVSAAEKTQLGWRLTVKQALT
jgi:hypothetical protein